MKLSEVVKMKGQQNQMYKMPIGFQKYDQEEEEIEEKYEEEKKEIDEEREEIQNIWNKFDEKAKVKMGKKIHQ